MKKQQLWLFIFSVILSVLGAVALGTRCSADPVSPDLGRRDFGFGWQFFQPASGLSLKIPIQNDYYLQPIFSFAMKEEAESLQKHFAIGIRGIYDFPARYDFRAYSGVALGHWFTLNNPASANHAAARSGSGYQAFFGVEYQKYLLRPALELGLGGYWSPEGNFTAGLVFNFSMLYYF